MTKINVNEIVEATISKNDGSFRRWRLVRDRLRTALVTPVRGVRLRHLSLLMISL